ncbi:hypothetical protein FRB97_001447, partial [Tulasnella sp. 331]
MSDLTLHLENITFQGKEMEDATQFLQNVKRVAFAQGRQRDQEWLVDYVETCLAGDALEWYTELDEETRFNFDHLRIAMIKRFRVTTPANIQPAPPAAVPPHTGGVTTGGSSTAGSQIPRKQMTSGLDGVNPTSAAASAQAPMSG